MPKITSEKQRRANQENASNSQSRRAGIGPKTAAGKARVARNALKHALLAANVVADTPNEHRAEFDALLTDICAELEPQGVIEETVVERK